MKIPTNLDDQIALGLSQDPASLEYSLAENLIVWRNYAAELAKGIEKLSNQIKEQAQ